MEREVPVVLTDERYRGCLVGGSGTPSRGGTGQGRGMRGLKKKSQCASAPAWRGGGARGGASSEAKGKSVPTRPRRQAGWGKAGRSSGKAERHTSLLRVTCVRERRDRRWAPTRRKACAGGMQTGAGARRDTHLAPQKPGRQTRRGWPRGH